MNSIVFFLSPTTVCRNFFWRLLALGFVSLGCCCHAMADNTGLLMNVNSKTLQMPNVGDSALNILSPTLLELQLINTEEEGAAGVTNWNFVNTSGELQTPEPTEFAVTVNGQSVAVQAVGFKRRPLYAPLLNYDLRIENSLYLQLAAPIADNQA